MMNETLRQQAADRLRRAVTREAYDEVQVAIADYRREVEATIAAWHPDEPAPVEVVREAATLLMLAGVASVAAERRMWLSAFAIGFGVWDIFYYVFLRLLLGWPASLFTWDVLFLIPAPWAAPVLAPVIVSLSLVAGGMVGLKRAVHLSWWHWAGIGSGAVAILLSFLWDSPNVLAGGFPHSFFWGLFAAGEAVGFGSFLIALRNE